MTDQNPAIADVVAQAMSSAPYTSGKLIVAEDVLQGESATPGSGARYFDVLEITDPVANFWLITMIWVRWSASGCTIVVNRLTEAIEAFRPERVSPPFANDVSNSRAMMPSSDWRNRGRARYHQLKKTPGPPARRVCPSYANRARTTPGSPGGVETLSDVLSGVRRSTRRGTAATPRDTLGADDGAPLGVIIGKSPRKTCCSLIHRFIVHEPCGHEHQRTKIVGVVLPLLRGGGPRNDDHSSWSAST